MAAPDSDAVATRLAVIAAEPDQKARTEQYRELLSGLVTAASEEGLCAFVDHGVSHSSKPHAVQRTAAECREGGLCSILCSTLRRILTQPRSSRDHPTSQCCLTTSPWSSAARCCHLLRRSSARCRLPHTRPWRTSAHPHARLHLRLHLSVRCTPMACTCFIIDRANHRACACKHSALARMAPRGVSFLEQSTGLRERLAEVLEGEEAWAAAAQVLAGIDLDSGVKA